VRVEHFHRVADRFCVAGTDRSATLKQALGKLAVLALAGFATYVLAVYFLAPRLFEHRLESIVERHTDLTLAIETVAVNPFNLALLVDKLTLIGPENAPAVSMERVDARIRLAGSLAAATWVLEDVVVNKPHVDLIGPYVADAAEVSSDPTLEIGKDGIRVAGDLEARELAVTDTERDAVLLTLDVLTAADVTLDASSSHVADRVLLASPRIRLQRTVDSPSPWPESLVEQLLDPIAGRYTIRAVDIVEGELSLVDEVAQPPVRAALDAIDGRITQQRPGAPLTIGLHWRIGDGDGEIRTEWLPGQSAETLNADLALRDVDMSIVSSYVAAAVGRAVKSGRLDLDVGFDLDDPGGGLENRLEIRHLELGPPDAPTERSIELAMALLEDATGRIAFSLPMPDVQNSLKNPLPASASAFEDFVAGLTAVPFEYLAALGGRPDLELARLDFPAGSTEVAADARAKLAVLGRALELRPTLHLIVHGGYNRTADRAALARRQVQLHVNLAASARPSVDASADPIEFGDSTVQSVLDEFAAERLPGPRRTAIEARHSARSARYYRAVFEALVDNEDVTQQALERLARYRARTIADALEEAGIGAARVVDAGTVEAIGLATAGRGVVRLEVRPPDVGRPL